MTAQDWLGGFTTLATFAAALGLIVFVVVELFLNR